MNIRLLSSLPALSIGVALFGACEPPILKTPGAQLSGTVKISSALKPLLPPPSGAQGTNFAEVEPNTVPPNEVSIVPDIVADGPPTIITASMIGSSCGGANDCRDRFQIQVTGDASVTFVVEKTGGGGSINCLVSPDLAFPTTGDAIAGDFFGGDTPLTFSALLPGNTPFILNMRNQADGELDYKVTITAVSGTVVGKVFVGAYLASDGHPALFEDPVRHPKNPAGGQIVDANIHLDDEGNWVGDFKNLSVVNVKQSTDLVLFAYADNDGSSSAAPVNLVLNPPTAPDFIASQLFHIAAPADGDAVEGIDLAIDSRVTDLDFDGVLDEDRNGDGVPDDNCPNIPNVDQADGDGDGVGDACDDCPDVADADQTNTDGVGRGDACNQDASSACPRFGVYPVDVGSNECFVDSDDDEIDDQALACDEGVPFCLPPSQNNQTPKVADKKVAKVVAVDNCKSDANNDQLDSDSDGQGDACDADDDADGVNDDVDNCPLAANADQKDGDGDLVGDKCDNCPTTANPDQLDSDGDTFLAADGITELTRGDACDADDDGDGICDPGVTPAADETCTGEDNCPLVANPGQLDSDGDGTGDACDLCADATGGTSDTDTDADGLGDSCDTCDAAPVDCETDDDCAGIGGNGVCQANGKCSPTPPCASDADCATAGNTCLESGFCIAENDGDGDGLADACDRDQDDDGVFDIGGANGDNCEGLANPKRTCTTDADCAHAGNCEIAPGAATGTCTKQDDFDGDGIGDACDPCPGKADDGTDSDSDGDGLGDACDLCPHVATGPVTCKPCVANADCGAGQICDVDSALHDAAHPATFECIDDPRDDDGTAATVHKGACQAAGAGVCLPHGLDDAGKAVGQCAHDGDLDKDGKGDACDADDDGDGVCDPCGLAAPLPQCTGALITNECTGADNCPTDANPADADGVQADLDGDGVGDACDAETDDDADGVPNNLDNCPAVANEDQADGDEDGVGDACDNCVDDANADQADSDADAPDGVGDTCDNCPTVGNEDQADADDDGVGDACDRDADNDGIANAADNCPLDSNANQADGDHDGVGDACDNCATIRNTNQNDFDADGRGDVCDNCVRTANFDQLDDDHDVVGNACDNCPIDVNRDQLDNEGDGIGDLCDLDDDNDGVDDVDDNCPTIANADQGDVNGNDIGDACDPDADDDGLCTPGFEDAPGGTGCAGTDLCPNDDSTEAPTNYNEANDGAFSADVGAPTVIAGPGAGGLLTDNNLLTVTGTVAQGEVDFFQITPPALGPERRGLAHWTAVDASDATVDLSDQLEVDVTAGANTGPAPVGVDFKVGLAGAPRLYTVTNLATDGTVIAYTFTVEIGGNLDLDGDGIGDICDSCSLHANVGDTDEDGVDDSCDACVVAEGNTADVCAGIDTDNDQVCDPGVAAGADAPDGCAPGLDDNCPDDPNPDQTDSDNDGVGDACQDSDGDGVPDAFDGCPGVTDSGADDDGDGIDDACDNCPGVENEDQLDSDHDGVGDACIPAGDDNDSDGIKNELDNCPDDANTNQADSDGNGVGDVCDDDDGDTVKNAADNCPNDANTDQADGDGDLVGDVCDNCPTVDNADQADQDEDGFGDACDVDIDGDGICNNDCDLPGAALACVPTATRDSIDPQATDFDGQVCTGVDNCSLIANTDQADSDENGVGDVCDGAVFTPPTQFEVEPNDAAPQTIIIGSPNTPTVVLGTAEGDDLYEVTAPADGLLTMVVTFDSSDPATDIDAAFLPADTTDLAEGAQAGNPEIGSLVVHKGDVIDIDINLFDGSPASYSMRLAIVADVEAADIFEPNDVGAIRTGDFFDINHELSGTLADARGDGGLNWNGTPDGNEADVWTVTAVSAGTLHVVLDFAAGNDLDVLLWSQRPNADGVGLLTQDGATGNPQEVVDLPVEANETVFISAHSFDLGADPTGAYNLTLTLNAQ